MQPVLTLLEHRKSMKFSTFWHFSIFPGKPHFYGYGPSGIWPVLDTFVTFVDSGGFVWKLWGLWRVSDILESQKRHFCRFGSFDQNEEFRRKYRHLLYLCPNVIWGELRSYAPADDAGVDAFGVNFIRSCFRYFGPISLIPKSHFLEFELTRNFTTFCNFSKKRPETALPQGTIKSDPRGLWSFPILKG